MWLSFRLFPARRDAASYQQAEAVASARRFDGEVRVVGGGGTVFRGLPPPHAPPRPGQESLSRTVPHPPLAQQHPQSHHPIPHGTEIQMYQLRSSILEFTYFSN